MQSVAMSKSISPSWHRRDQISALRAGRKICEDLVEWRRAKTGTSIAATAYQSNVNSKFLDRPTKKRLIKIGSSVRKRRKDKHLTVGLAEFVLGRCGHLRSNQFLEFL